MHMNPRRAAQVSAYDCARWRYRVTSGRRRISRWRRFHHGPARGRNPVPLAVHALQIAVVVASLQLVGGHLRSAGSGRTAHQQAGSGADRRAIAAAHRRTYRGAENGADGSTLYAAVNAGLIGGRAADLIAGELPAIGIVHAELIESLGAARQHQHAGSARHGSAAAEKEQRGKRSKFMDVGHGDGCMKWIRSG